MSRIGKNPIVVPPSVSLKIENNVVYAKGSKGELQQALPTEITVELKDNMLLLSRLSDDKRTKSLHGLYRMLCAHIIHGVDNGFTKELIIKGVGYRAEVTKTHVVFNLGYSTQIYYTIPNDVQIAYDKKEKVTVTGIDKQRVGQVAAEIRSLRPVEPYKGKGIRYIDEQVRLKVGKAGVK